MYIIILYMYIICKINLFLITKMYLVDIFILIIIIQAWTWAVKAANELHDKCSNTIRLSVINHVIKASCAANKFKIAKKLIEQVYTFKKEFGQIPCVDVLLNTVYYSWKTDLPKLFYSNYYVIFI